MVNKKIPNRDNTYYFVSFFLRVGLATVFLYVGIAAIFSPETWLGFIPGFMRKIISGNLFLHIHSIFNICLALWLLSNKKTFYASTLASITLFAIIIFNFSALDIVFRDLSILFSAIALMFLSHRGK